MLHSEKWNPDYKTLRCRVNVKLSKICCLYPTCPIKEVLLLHPCLLHCNLICWSFHEVCSNRCFPSLMSPDLCTDFSAPWLILQHVGSVCQFMCVLAVFTGVCRLPGTLQVSVSIIPKTEHEPVEAMSAVFSFGSVLILCHWVWQTGLSSQSNHIDMVFDQVYISSRLGIFYYNNKWVNKKM